MSLTLVSEPVFVDVQGKTVNIFQGFLPVNYNFKREDETVVDVTSGIGSNLEITTGIDISNQLEIGQFIYLSSELYELQGDIIAISGTDITITGVFIGNTTGGYINFRKNWFIEIQLVDPINTNVDILGYALQNDGDLAGNILFNVNNINDKNSLDYLTTSGAVEDGRIKCKVKYTEFFEGSNETPIIIPTEIIIIASRGQFLLDQFLIDFTDPQLFLGYPIGYGFMHTDFVAQEGKKIRIIYDELDINKDIITTDNLLSQFDDGDFGLFFASAQGLESTLNDNTRFLNLRGEIVFLGDYNPSDYHPDDYDTT